MQHHYTRLPTKDCGNNITDESKETLHTQASSTNSKSEEEEEDFTQAARSIA